MKKIFKMSVFCFSHYSSFIWLNLTVNLSTSLGFKVFLLTTYSFSAPRPISLCHTSPCHRPQVPDVQVKEEINVVVLELYESTSG